MVTCGMGSQGDGNGVDEAKANALGRQGSSLYNLTFDEVQNQLGGFGKPLNSMNLDELVKTVWTIEATQELGRNDCLQQQSSITMPRDLSNKTVDEVWQDIHKRDNSVNKINQERQLTLGEITLEDFLVKAGIIADSTHGKSQAEWPHYQIPGIHQTLEQQNSLPVFIPVHQVQQPLPVVPSPTYPCFD